MVIFCPLASGSKGNCSFLGNDKTKLLIDAGISARTIEQRLNLLGFSLDQIDAIVITHDHADHIAGLRVLSKRSKVPIVCNLATAQGLAQYLGQTPRCKIFQTGESFEIGEFLLHPFSIQHDTGDPVGFSIEIKSDHQILKVGICTDLGIVTSLVTDHLRNCDCLYIEANHDPDLVALSLRPQIYKQRVLGRMGHLSNAACAQLVGEIAHDRLQRIYLAHLSEECNRHELALKTVSSALLPHFRRLDLQTAKQHEMSIPIALTAQRLTIGPALPDVKIHMPSLCSDLELAFQESAKVPFSSKALPGTG